MIYSFASEYVGDLAESEDIAKSAELVPPETNNEQSLKQINT